MIPEWFVIKDNYVPREKKNLYIEKSIYSIIKIISIIRQSKNQNRLFYLINPTLKVISTIIMIICVYISRNIIYLLIMDIYAFLSVFLIEKRLEKRILFRSSIFSLITLITLVPSMFCGDIHNSLLLFEKVIITTLLMNILAHNTKWTEISKSLKLLLVTDMFIWIMDITIKYIVLLGECSIDFLYALKLRSVGTTSNKYNSLTGIMGNLFIKSYKLSEEMFHAMECRGFVGEYTTKISLKFRKIDYLYLIVNLLLVSLSIYLNY